MTAFFHWLRCRRLRRLLRQRRERRADLARQFRRTIVRRCGPINVSLWSPDDSHYYYLWTYSPRQRFVWILDRTGVCASAFRRAAKLALDDELVQERTP